MLHASCHCGAVRLEISRKPRTLTECNCSICGRLAARWAYYSAKSVRVLCNPGVLQAYVYKNGTFEYNHCKICGCVTHYRRINTSNNERIAVNSRMMAPDDVTSIKVITLYIRKASNRPCGPQAPRRRVGVWAFRCPFPPILDSFINRVF